MKKVYLDYASLTPVDKRVLRHMKKYQTKEYGNPSALYASGVAAKKALLEAREKVAKVLHAHPDEIIFTASGTESNNLVLHNFLDRHVMISAIEHSSIIENVNKKVTCISVDKDGLVDLESLKKSITPETVLVSVMMVNNEIGAIEPIQEIAKIIRHVRKNNNSIYPLFHTDACQAIHLPIHIEKLGVDLLTLDGHKIYGPRGVGMLYIRRGIELAPLIHGGGQERGLRSGTENVAAIQGFACALELADKMREVETVRISTLKNFFAEELYKINNRISINGNSEKTSPHILNISIPNIDNEFFVLQLDAKGIECSTKSACLKDEDESYALKAIETDSKNSVRFSFGRDTTKFDIKYVLKVIAKIFSNAYN